MTCQFRWDIMTTVRTVWLSGWILLAISVWDTCALPPSFHRTQNAFTSFFNNDRTKDLLITNASDCHLILVAEDKFLLINFPALLTLSFKRNEYLAPRP